MFYDSFDVWWWPFLFILLAGVLPTAVWRWAGALLVGNLDENSQWLVFIRCIATSLVAAVIAQFVFFPTGALAEIGLPVRLAAAGVGFAGYLVSGRNLFLGIISGELVLIAGKLLS